MVQITKNNYFQLDTKNTSYCFRVLPTGQLEHLYYGRKICVTDPEALAEQQVFAPGNTIAYDEEHATCSLEDICLEMSGLGKGDVREPLIELVAADGSNTTDFVFQKSVLRKGKRKFAQLPGSYDDQGQADHLTLFLKDRNHEYSLELNYYIYEDTDVITRNCRLVNTGNEPLVLKRLMSMQIDFPRKGYVISSFHGGWTNEMNRSDVTLNGGTFVNASYTGTSSSRSNPFIMIASKETTEQEGDCFGFNLIYSGNHYEAAEVSGFGKTRFVTGINPRNFSFRLTPGEDFTAPEAVMTYSSEGYGGMSRRMHAFVRKHIVRGVWRDKERPVLLNSWEASYFNISEASLLKLAKAGKNVGVELFVMDDGWFGTRDDDTQSLGDWTPNLKKLPGGLDRLARKINELGLQFGIWVEPEMVNVNSDLYRRHPEWSMEIPGMRHSQGRNQRILDLCNPEVVDYLIETMSAVFSNANISYVKWDMNRIVSDYYSQYLPADRQQEVAHRYVLGLYRLMGELTGRFPDILFEGCASGGNRFDLGMLCYFPQIWGSDNTDAISRLDIQEGYSYGYPLSTVGAHVSACPNHQTLRTTPLSTRFAVASFGVLGYECNLCDMKKEELDEIRQQITLYKKYRSVLQQGEFYREKTGNIVQWTCVSQDKSKAVGISVQRELKAAEASLHFRASGLKENAQYRFFSIPAKIEINTFGSLVNMISPIHIKQDSLIHHALAKFVKMDGEAEDRICPGSVLKHEGICLKQAFVGTGFSDQVRCYPDYASRFYFMEEIDEETPKLEQNENK